MFICVVGDRPGVGIRDIVGGTVVLVTEYEPNARAWLKRTNIPGKKAWYIKMDGERDYMLSQFITPETTSKANPFLLSEGDGEPFSPYDVPDEEPPEDEDQPPASSGVFGAS